VAVYSVDSVGPGDERVYASAIWRDADAHQHAAAVACCGLIVGNGVRDQRAVGSIVHKDAAAFVGGIAQNSVIRHLHIVCFPELERSPFFLRRIFPESVAADGNLPNSAYYQSTAIVGGIAADGIGLHRYLTDVI